MPPVTFPSHSHLPASNAPDDLPKNVARSLIQGSSPMSMDFHPIQQTLLLGVCHFPGKIQVSNSSTSILFFAMDVLQV